MIWYIESIVFTIVFGSLLHFVYKWSGNNLIVGVFGAVNESTWEHLKLLFWPAFIFSIVEYFLIGRQYNNYITAKAISFYLGISLIVCLFYIYTGIVGKNFLFVDISIFIISVIVSQYVSYIITKSSIQINDTANLVSVIATILLVLSFIFFTFTPPQIQLFKDPVEGGYGIEAF